MMLFSSYQQVKTKLSRSAKKSIIYHRILKVILESFKDSQDVGLVWNLEYELGEFHTIQFVFPLCLCIVDMKGGKQLCSMYDSAQSRRSCISCFCTPEDLASSHKVCKPVTADIMNDVIFSTNEENKKDDLRAISQHPNEENAFFNLSTGGWPYGIWGLCPTEVLHQFYEGIVSYALEEFFVFVLTPKSTKNMERIMKHIFLQSGINQIKNTRLEHFLWVYPSCQK